MAGWGRAFGIAFVAHLFLAVLLFLVHFDRSTVSRPDRSQVRVPIRLVPGPSVPEPSVSPPPVRASRRRAAEQSERRRRRGPTAPVRVEEPDGPPPARRPASEAEASVLRPDGERSLDLRPRIAPPKTSTTPSLIVEAAKAPEGPQLLLEPRDDDRPGEWTILRTKPFDTRIREDGTVELSDRRFHHELRFRPNLQPGIDLDASGREPSSMKEREPDIADLGADAPMLVYRFGPDLNDEILRLFGDDPYAYDKRRFMEQTRDARLRLAIAACKERLDRAVLEIRGRLERIDGDPTVPLEQKKRLMFELWDECAESGSDEVLLVAAIVRATIVAYIREHFPAQGPLAFSPGEIAVLNERRRSKARFAPYRAR